VFKRNVLLAALATCGLMSGATIGFEIAEGTYVPTPGVAQNVKNQFASLGIIFQDVANPALGVTLGKCGPGNGAVALFGHGADFAGCGDTTPNFDILFVDPANPLNAGYTTSFSVVNFDGLIQLSAYDIGGNLLGSTSAFSGTLSLSGIGQISRVNLLSLDQDPTTMDDISFADVTPLAAVPEPGTFVLLSAGLALLAFRRR
jgi:PEP-CTERM motif